MMSLVSRGGSVGPLANEFPAWTPFHYVHNNLVNMTDPDGRSAICETCPDRHDYDQFRVSPMVFEYNQGTEGADGLGTVSPVNTLVSNGATVIQPRSQVNSNQSVSSSSRHSIPAGESSFRITETTWFGGGEGVSGSYGRLEISSSSKTPEGLEGKLTSGNSSSLGWGVGSPVEIMSATSGNVVFDKDVSGSSIQEVFSESRYIRTRSMGSLIKYTRLEAYTDQSMSTPVFHSDMVGGGVITLGGSGSASMVNFRKK